ncbi:hypothetical protein [Salmonirosea aquatica]|uniref:DUF1990 family protein n=1 Tax=Salmonirosea aquatica TaxID=2654236 RepID=A0A7C9BEF5_9BACT|nr:hypothetical protein [Cytophagaceae bacterium SJW1-29]
MSFSLPNSVRLDRVQQKTIREYIRNRGLFICSDFDNLKTTCFKPAERETYHIHTKSFEVDADLDQVWNTYLSISPKETWRCRTVSFGCMYCKKSKAITYAKDEYKGLREGQVLFLNVGLFWGMVNIAVAHQITRIEPVEKYIEFSYIEGGETEGSQRLSFSQTSQGTTEIVHKTTYRGKTKSLFREKTLYPILHARVISAFHWNVKQKVIAGTVSPA